MVVVAMSIPIVVSIMVSGFKIRGRGEGRLDRERNCIRGSGKMMCLLVQE